MQVLTEKQVQQLNITAQSAWDALVLVEDAFCHAVDRVLVALTSERAIAGYRLLWFIVSELTIIAWMLMKLGVTVFQQWANGLVESCLEQPVEESVQEAIAPVTEEPSPDVWDAPTQTVCLLASEVVVSAPVMPLMAPAPEVVDVQPKRRKTAAKKTTTRKTGGRAKSKLESVGA